MEAKHIDDRIPGEIERIQAIQKLEWEESRMTVYRSCEDCWKDIIVEINDGNSEDEDEEIEEETGDETNDEDSLDGEERTTSGNDIPVLQEDDPAIGKEVSNLDEETDEKDTPAGEGESPVNGKGTSELAIRYDLPPSPNKDLESEEPFFQNLMKDDLPPTHQRFLCHYCTEKAAAKELQCTVCFDEFIPSHDAYTAEEPICRQCI